jgi:uncharacterized protein
MISTPRPQDLDDPARGRDAGSSRPLALVTGASTGIGRSLTGLLAGRGFDVIAVADEEKVAEVAAQARGAAGEIRAVRADLSQEAGVEDTWDAVLQAGRPLAAAALNAGVGVNGRFDQTALDDDLAVVDLNVRSTVHLAKLVTRQMVAAGGGRILVTSSIAAVAPGPYHATYAASKAFVHSFAEGIRTELSGTGVSVTSVMPGPTETEFFARADMEDSRIGQMEDKDDPDQVAEQAIEALMAGRASVVTGSVTNRLQAEVATHLPDRLAAPLLARMAKPRD